ncbi:hypothetical protein GpartN1_g5441.t1 [Galdieria partita]|uniref:Ethanolaminephosphotransferase n=1 Tax=Galdieria partita TaxID=83374 RepID=A0A9C7Q058_9RHOD|nr:hypothetical protein GpartN1_g5441.t1 [Galdieria partita]
MVPPEEDSLPQRRRRVRPQNGPIRNENIIQNKFERAPGSQVPYSELKDLRKLAGETFFLTAVKNSFLLLTNLFLGSPQFTEEQLEALHRYKNFGEDHSLLYRYVLSHLYNMAVHLLPKRLAPNLITFIGLLFALFSHGVVMYYCPDFDCDAPRVVYLIASASLFIYMLLDNLDGRQARRTNSSSPLGHLFDHGCDALNVTISGLTFAAVIRLGRSLWAVFIIWVYGMLPFFFATLEEFFTGALVLRQFNGPNEGLILMQLFYLLTALKGSSFWKRKTSIFSFSFPIEWNKFLILLAVPLCVPTIIGNYREIWRDANRKGKNISQVKRRSILYSLPFVLFSICTFSWFIYSPVTLRSHLIMFMWTCGSVFFALVTRLIVAHLTDSEYKSVFFIEAPLVLGAMNSICGFLFETQIFSDVVVLFAAFLFCLLMNGIRVYQIVGEITNSLGIYCFSLKKPRVKEQ